MLSVRSQKQNTSGSKCTRLTLAERRAKEKEEKRAMREKMEAERIYNESREKVEAEHVQNEMDHEFAKAMQKEFDKEEMVREAVAAVEEVSSDPESNPLLLPRQNKEQSR